MKVHKKIVYHKNTKVGRAPCTYNALQPKGVNTDVYVTIKLDPILKKKKLSKVKNGMLKHEIVEVTRWAKGDRYSHRDAEKVEPAITRDKIKNTSGFWRYCRKNKIM